MGQAQHFFFIIFEVIDKASNAVKVIEAHMKAVSNVMGDLNKRTGGFDMRLLSLMFTGMALTRLMGGLFKSLDSGYRKVENNTSAWMVATNHLGASWEFLKYTIMEALNNPFIISFVFR